jgi:endonuclease/exonuclease/phosphatase family metal-dependent hydrolase
MRLTGWAVGVWLLGSGAAGAGTATVKLTTWNMEWLTARGAGDGQLPPDVVPRVPGDFVRLRAYAAALDADVIAVEEVDGPEVLARVFPTTQYHLVFTHDHVVQRVGLAVRYGIGVTQNDDVTALDVYGADAKFPLRSGLDATLHFDDGRTLRVLAVHLKSGCWDRALGGKAPACVALAEQLPVLQAWIAARQAEHTPFAVLGDFNRVMDGKDPFVAALDAAAPLTRATAGFADPCWDGDRFIDHILLGGAAAGWLVPASLRVLVYRETDDADRAHLSDHCPVSVRLNLPG